MESKSEHQLSGSVQRILNRNPESGWAVLEVEYDGKQATVIGSLSHVDEGLRIEADGAWVKHKTFGWQFKANAARIFPPVSADGIERFLRSGAVDGIGPVFAKKIVSKFSDKTLTVIEKERWRLSYLKGVGPKRLRAVSNGVKEYRDRMEVMSFLHGQLGPLRAHRVYEKYGDQSREKISKNPYRLIDDFDGVGFKVADKVARDVGVGLDHPLRLKAAVMATLSEASRQGHTCVDVETCLKRAEELLGSTARAQQAVAEAGKAKDWGLVSRDGVEHLELRRFSFLDTRIASRLHVLATRGCRVPTIDPSLAIPWAEEKVGLTFEGGQKDAIALALQEKVCIITGGPGTGKTTILNGLLRILNAKKVNVALAAPTGRASKRMSESTGRPAQTIHRLLEYIPKTRGFSRKKGNPIEQDVLVVDESSMTDLSLLRAVLEAMPDDGRLILVGDKDQLPSVGPGQTLGDLIESGVLPVASLSEPFRQAANSSIIRNAYQVNRGNVPDLDVTDDQFEFIETKNADETASAIVETICERLPSEGFDVDNDVMCLSSMHARGAGVETLNTLLQARINPTPGDFIERGTRRFATGDKVIQNANNRELQLFNGDIGVIKSINKEDKCLDIQFDGVMVEYPFSEIWSLAPARCCSIHKAQGSQAAVVVIAVDMSNSILLGRKLLYTAITRAQRKVILVGQKRAVFIAVSEARAHVRQTRLRQKVVSAFTSEGSRTNANAELSESNC